MEKIVGYTKNKAANQGGFKDSFCNITSRLIMQLELIIQ